MNKNFASAFYHPLKACVLSRNEHFRGVVLIDTHFISGRLFSFIYLFIYLFYITKIFERVLRLHLVENMESQNLMNMSS